MVRSKLIHVCNKIFLAILVLLSCRQLCQAVILSETPGKWCLCGLFVVIASLAYRWPRFTLFSWFSCLPLLRGLITIGWLPYAPHISWISLSLSAIALGYFTKSLRRTDTTCHAIPTLDLLAGYLSAITFLSACFVASSFPIVFALKQLISTSTFDQMNVLYSFDAATIIVHGMFVLVYAAAVFSVDSERGEKWIIAAFLTNAVIIVVFAFIQWKWNVPAAGNIIQSPFEDKNSIASYDILVFFVLLSNVLWRRFSFHSAIALVFCCFLVSHILLSYSRAGWIAFCLGMLGMAFLRLRKETNPKTIAILASILIFFAAFLMTVLSIGKPEFRQYFIERFNTLRIDKIQSVLHGDRGALEELLLNRTWKWAQAFEMLREHPISGTGVGTYFRTSYLFGETGQDPKLKHENAHNQVMQYFAEFGAPFTLLFLILCSMAFVAYFKQINSSPGTMCIEHGLFVGLTAFLITCSTGHPLLLPEQFGVFGFAAGAIIGIWRSSSSDIDLTSRKMRFLIHVLGVLGIVGMLFNFLCPDTMKPKGWSIDAYGVYDWEDWGGRNMRWAMDKSGIKIPAKNSIIGVFLRVHPEVTRAGDFSLDISQNGEPLLKKFFPAPVDDWLYLGTHCRKNYSYFLEFKANRVFLPKQCGLGSDNRALSFAQSAPTIITAFPANGVGFYDWEIWTDPIPEWPQGVIQKFRWTHGSVILSLPPIDGIAHEDSIFILCSHPDVSTRPVLVNLSTDTEWCSEIAFNKTGWEKIIVPKECTYIVINVDRTWNPARAGVSSDTRELGVVVAIPGLDPDNK